MSVVDRINEYLQLGGLFNPELANHQAVRDLLIDCRNHIRELEMKVESKTVTIIENRVNLELTEYEANVIAMIMGRVGGNHEFRKVTNPLYNQLIRALGQNVYDKFEKEHPNAIERSMYLKDSV